MTTPKYKVGDKVFVEAEVIKVDPADIGLMYTLEVGGYNIGWVPQKYVEGNPDKRHAHMDLMMSYARDCTQVVETEQQLFHELPTWSRVDDPSWLSEGRYRLKPGKKKVTMKDIEEKFGGPVEIVEEV